MKLLLELISLGPENDMSLELYQVTVALFLAGISANRYMAELWFQHLSHCHRNNQITRREVLWLNHVVKCS